MNILVVGSGGREHALAWKLAAEPGVARVICAPGNAGIARDVHTAAIDAGNIQALLDLARREHVDLTVVGPELPLEAVGAAARSIGYEVLTRLGARFHRHYVDRGGD